MKEKIMISLRHPGKCSVCEKDIEVVTLGDTKTRKVAYVCEECSKKLDMKTSTFVKKYGKKDEGPFKPGIRFLPGERKQRVSNVYNSGKQIYVLSLCLGGLFRFLVVFWHVKLSM